MKLKPNRKNSIASAALLSMATWMSPACLAQQAELGSAKLAPADADFYSVALRMPEQWNRFVSGPVVSRFLELPPVENAVEQFRSEWSEREGFGASVRTGMENPNAKEALAFVGELLKKEVFALGDKNVSLWYAAQAKLNDDMRAIALEPGLEETERTIKVLTKTFKLLEDLTIPRVLVGAKCDDVDLALGKIDQLELLVNLGMTAIPNGSLFFKNFERIDDARGDRLQLRLDGTQVPWDEIPTNGVFGEDELAQLKSIVEKKSLVITVGMFDGYFVAGLSPTSKSLLELGKTQSILDIPEMQVVKDAMAKPLTSVSYTSNALAKATFDANFKNFFSRNGITMVGPALGMIDPDSDIRKFVMDLIGDFTWMDESIAELVPEFKGTTSFSMITADGWERHDYNRTQGAISESAAPLSLLENLGTDPMMFLTLKLQYKPEYFQLCRKIVQKFKARLEESYDLDWTELQDALGLSTSMDSDEVKSWIDWSWPFLVRLADTWEKKFLPAMSGEHSVVMSGGNLSSKQWYKDMPASVDPLSVPEIASLCVLKDRALFDSAIEDLFKIGDDLVDAYRAKSPDQLPPGYKIPRPNKSQSNAGVTFAYPIPADCPAPKEMMPQALFAGKVLIESYSNKQSEALATPRKLDKGLGVINPTANLSNASYLNLGKIFDFARPWIRYALTEGMESMDDSLMDGMLPSNYELTGKDLLTLWSVFSKFGELASATTSTASGGAHVHTIYKSQKAE